jgi:hypothetical protein
MNLALLDQLQKALDLGGNTHDMGDVAQAIECGEAKLWATEKALILTEVDEYPQRRVANVWLASGDLTEILQMAPAIYDWAREQGCDTITLLGRKGWAKALVADGWSKSKMVLMEKKLYE